MQVTVKVEAGEVKVGLNRLGQAIPRVTNADIELSMKGAIDELKRPGRPITYPVHWDSERQRRAYFATDGFGHGIPYKRTGAYNAGYEVVKTGSGAHREYKLINDVPYAKYVGGTGYGTHQSRIHAGRWAIAAKVVQKHAQNLVRNVTQSIRDVIRAEGFGL